MRNGIGRAMLRGTLASVAGIAAMDLYSKAMKRIQESASSRRQHQGQQEHAQEERRERQQAGRRAQDRRREPSRVGDGSEQGAQGESSGDFRGEEAHGGDGHAGDALGEHARGGDGHGVGAHALDDISVVGHPRKEGEPATVAVGRIFYERLKHEEPSRERGAQLGTAVHWGYGMAMGSVFGLLEPKVKDHDLSAGLGYGAALWLLGDEVAVPLLGLAEGPTAHPPSVHAQALAAHLVYGLTTSAATRVLRRVI